MPWTCFLNIHLRCNLEIKMRISLQMAFADYLVYLICNTLVSDQGTEVIAKVMQELCASLQIKPEFTLISCIIT